MKKDYKITKLNTLESGFRQQAVRLFVEGFYDMIKSISADKDVLFQLFEPALRNDMAYVCFDGEKVVGLLAYSDNKRRAFDIERSGVSRVFGSVKSRVIKTQLMFIIGKPAVKRDDEGYIDFLATDPACRGQGIATKMINYVAENAGIASLSLDVIGDNGNAIRLYRHLGFKTTEIQDNLLLRIAGIRKLLIMKKELYE